MPEASGGGENARTVLVYRAIYAACALAFLVLIARFYRSGVGLSPMLLFGSDFFRNALPEVKAQDLFVVNGVGYDAQFYAQVAVRPWPWSLELQQALDRPWYRPQRIFPSLVAWVFGLGQPALIVQAYAAQYIVVWLLTALVLVALFPPKDGWNLIAWVGCLFSAGMMMSITRALPDAWGFLLIAAGFYFWQRSRANATTGMLALAGLSREPAILATVMLLGERIADFPKAAKNVAIAVAPAFVWLGVLRAFGGDTPIPDNFSPPLVGLWEATVGRVAPAAAAVVSAPPPVAGQTPEHLIGSLAADHWRTAGVFTLLVALGIQSAFFVLRLRPRDWAWRVGIIHVALLLVLGWIHWAGWSVSRVLLPLLLAFNFSVPRTRAYLPVLVGGNLSVIFGLHMLTHPPF